MTGVLLPFGLAADGRMLTVGEVARGLECGCLCPQCGAALVARHGDIRQRHFAHYIDVDCQGARETALHKFAKQVLCEEKLVLLPPIVVTVGFRNTQVRGEFPFLAATCEAEVTIGDLRPDVLASTPFMRVALEVFVAHRVPPEKVVKLQELKLDTIEIDLSTFVRHLDPAVIREKILSTAHRSWLYCSEAEAHRTRLQADHDRAVAEVEDRKRRLVERDRYRQAEMIERAERKEAMERAQREQPIRAVNPIPVDGLLRASKMRPPRWESADAWVTPGAFCSRCQGQSFATDGTGWSCVSCHPIASQTGAAA